MPDLNHEEAPDAMEEQVKTAAADLKQLSDENEDARGRFESAQWSGLDQLNTVRDRLDGASDTLTTVADKLGLSAEVVATLRENTMVGTKDSVTG